MIFLPALCGPFPCSLSEDDICGSSSEEADGTFFLIWRLSARNLTLSLTADEPRRWPDWRGLRVPTCPCSFATNYRRDGAALRHQRTQQIVRRSSRGRTSSVGLGSKGGSFRAVSHSSEER